MTINSDFDNVFRKQISLGREIRGEWGGGSTNVKISDYQKRYGLDQDNNTDGVYNNTFGGWWKPKTGLFIRTNVFNPNERIKDQTDYRGMSFSDYQGSQNYKATRRILSGSQNWATQEYFFGRGSITFSTIHLFQAATTFAISNGRGYSEYKSDESGKPFGYGAMDPGHAVPEGIWSREWHQLINAKQHDFIQQTKYSNSFNVSIREIASELIKDASEVGLRYPPTHVRFHLMPTKEAVANSRQLKRFGFTDDDFNYKAFGTGSTGFLNWNLGGEAKSWTYTRNPGIKIYTTNAADFMKWRVARYGEPQSRAVGNLLDSTVRGTHYAQPRSYYLRGQNAGGSNINVQLNLVAGMTIKTNGDVDRTTALSLFTNSQRARGNVEVMPPPADKGDRNLPIRMHWWPNARGLNNNTGAWAVDRGNTAGTFRGFAEWNQNGPFGEYIDLKNELLQGRSRIAAFHTGDLYWASMLSNNFSYAYVNQIHIPPVELVVTT